MHEVRSADTSNDATFSLQWLGIIGGAALGNDAAPTNLGSVPANRILRCTAKRNGVVTMGGMTLRMVIADGTSLVVRPWFYDDTQAIWIPHGTAQTLTAASTNTASVVVGNMGGAKFFMQITTNTGNVSALGYDFV